MTIAAWKTFNIHNSVWIFQGTHGVYNLFPIQKKIGYGMQAMQNSDFLADIATIATTSGLIEQVAGTVKTQKQPTKRELWEIRRSEVMDEEAEQTGFLSRSLIQCTIPHKDPGNVPIWTRQNGAYTMVIRPGWDLRNKRQMGYPHGMVPRLILIWIVTEAKRTGVRRLELGDRFSDFVHELGLDPTRGGKRDASTRIKDQFKRLISAHISYQRTSVILKWDGQQLRDADYDHITNQAIVDDSKVGWFRKTDHSVKDSYIQLNESFFADIMGSAVPFDMRAVKALRKSPMALDLYLLCNYLGAVTSKEKGKHYLAWWMLAGQLGCQYQNPEDMRRKVKAAMKKVKLVHPELRIHYPPEGGGMEIYRSRPVIAPRLKQDLG